MRRGQLCDPTATSPEVGQNGLTLTEFERKVNGKCPTRRENYALNLPEKDL
jgi:hypothetical protein